MDRGGGLGREEKKERKERERKEKGRGEEDRKEKDRAEEDRKEKEEKKRKKSRWDVVGQQICASGMADSGHVTPLTSTSLPNKKRPSTSLSYEVPGLGKLFGESLSSSSSTSDTETTPCLVLNNMFDQTIQRDDDFYNDIKDHIHRNSAHCGSIFHIHVDRSEGVVYMRFDSKRSCERAMEKWNGKLYEGNTVAAAYMDYALYIRRFGFVDNKA